jgi:1A family penicillin-binding protein
MSGEPSRDWLRLGGSAGEGAPSKAAPEAPAEPPLPTHFPPLAPLSRVGDFARHIGSGAAQAATGVFARMRGRRWTIPAIGSGLAAFRARFTGRGDGRPRRALRIAALALACLVLPLLLYLAYAVATIPSDGGMAGEASPSAVFATSSDGQAIATRGVVKGEKLSSGDIPDNLKAAIVAIEDRRFRSHFGLDLWGMGRAVVRNISGGREGASTITQQLARLTYLSQERSLRRKVQEAAIAIWLEARTTKDDILAAYLNAAYFGGGAYGADAASRRYFGKPAKELDLPEAAMLAGLVRAPSQLAPHRNLAGARQRAELVLGAMVETGAIKPDQADAARKNPASVWEPPQAPPGAGYFVDLVEAEARRLAGETQSDIRVQATLDLRLQAASERIVSRILAQEGKAKNVGQAAVLVMATDGSVLAMVGGRDYAQSQFNRTTQAKRQAGSLFKLFVYLAALQAGASADSVMNDEPTQIGEWEPENYGGRYRGAVTLRQAFAASINTVAVQLADAVGIDKVIAVARHLGIVSDLPKVPSLALGSAEVTLMEMVRAYGMVLAGAGPIEPVLLRSVVRGSETVPVPSTPAAKGTFDPSVRETMLDLLQSVVTQGTGRAARIPNVPVGGKTGTTQESRDAWFVGVTPDLIVGVWVGNDDNTPTKGVTGGDMPARIFRAVATEALKLRQRQAARTRGREEARQNPAPAQPTGPIAGYASVRDTATLVIEGTEIRLAGLQGAGGREARDLARYIRRRPLQCEPDGSASPPLWRCIVDGQDLARLILFNGGARATDAASDDLRDAEEQAREAGLGVWGR